MGEEQRMEETESIVTVLNEILKTQVFISRTLKAMSFRIDLLENIVYRRNLNVEKIEEL